MKQHDVVSQEEWVSARKALMVKEKELTRARDQLSKEQRALPWVRMDKGYVFDAPTGKVTLGELFNGRDQLIIKHFMMGPGADHQCVGCSLAVDHVTGILTHLENHDVSYVVVARAPIEEIETVRKRMGWNIPWVSSFNSDFNFDFGVSFTPERIDAGTASYNYQPVEPWARGIQDLSGHSVFYKNNAGEIFHTYSTFARGDEEFLGIYRFLDVTPKGRNENGPNHSLADWARPHDKYDAGGTVEGNGRYHDAARKRAAHR